MSTILLVGGEKQKEMYPDELNAKLLMDRTFNQQQIDEVEGSGCCSQNVHVCVFFSSQEQKCEESFWKSCKIDFKETPFNYTLKQCHTPLIKVQDYNTSLFSIFLLPFLPFAACVCVVITSFCCCLICGQLWSDLFTCPLLFNCGCSRASHLFKLNNSTDLRCLSQTH